MDRRPMRRCRHKGDTEGEPIGQLIRLSDHRADVAIVPRGLLLELVRRAQAQPFGGSE